jgi:hypothetical protein
VERLVDVEELLPSLRPAIRFISRHIASRVHHSLTG